MNQNDESIARPAKDAVLDGGPGLARDEMTGAELEGMAGGTGDGGNGGLLFGDGGAGTALSDVGQGVKSGLFGNTL